MPTALEATIERARNDAGKIAKNSKTWPWPLTAEALHLEITPSPHHLMGMVTRSVYLGQHSLFQHDFRSRGMSKANNDDMDLSSGIAAFEGKHFATAMQLLSPLAEEGNVEAQYRVAIMYQNGLLGSQNLPEALKYMQAAADQGHALAQHGMGFMYLEGEGVEKNAAEAKKWFELAAGQGLVGSLTTLGMMYQEGNGVEQDEEKAREYYKKAGFDM
jgi:TPR repeat protein